MLHWKAKILALLEASRPMIWVFSIVSAFCGMSMGTKGIPPISTLIIVTIGVGPCITGAVNLLNGIFDVEIDRISKPGRPLPAGRISAASTLKAALLLYAIGLGLAFSFGLWPFALTLAGVMLSVLYSIPQVRIKSKGGLANLAVAIGYTSISFLGGWSIFRPPYEAPLVILILLTLQVAGANVVKDFVDYEADKEFNLATLPAKYGLRNTLVLVSPLLVGTYFVIPLLYAVGILGWRYLPVSLLSIWGVYITGSLTTDYSRKNRERAFLHAFWMSAATELAFAAAYILT